jgi:hypothetical protein
LQLPLAGCVELNALETVHPYGAIILRPDAARSADEMVLASSIVTVIGPTPPGTGVM